MTFSGGFGKVSNHKVFSRKHNINGNASQQSLYQSLYLIVLQKKDLLRNMTTSQHLAGEAIYIALFGTGAVTEQGEQALVKTRYQEFIKMFSKGKFSLPRLPPILDAADNHCRRTFLQVQCGLGNNLDSLTWECIL
ncbi:hypothetical protein NQ318_014576 [Aromia moschata]|uniref:Growth hormone n=1 Tax=Aromia moschata TaxID=1265417 RepID=A0AAV8Y0A0_9CUCU|nr:hypothetical protein NQ318_014576 [Aromia moschata]